MPSKNKLMTVASALAEYLMETHAMQVEKKTYGEEKVIEVRFSRNHELLPQEPDFVYSFDDSRGDDDPQSQFISSVVILSIYLVCASHIRSKEVRTMLTSTGVYDLEESCSFIRRMSDLMSEIDYVFADIVRMFSLGLDTLEAKEAH